MCRGWRPLHIRICNVQIVCWPLVGENFKWEHMRESQMFFDKCDAPPNSEYIKEAIMALESVGW